MEYRYIKFQIIALVLFLSWTVFHTESRADTHELTGNDSNWTCSLTVSGDGAKFLQEDAEYNVDDPYELWNHVILYHIRNTVELTYTATYSGPTGTNTQFYIDGVSGTEVSYTVEYDPSVAMYTSGARIINTGVSWEEQVTDENGETTTITRSSSAQFLANVQLWYPLSVTIENPYGAGTRRLIHSLKQTPVIVTDGDGHDSITITYESMGDVGVKVLSMEGENIYPADEKWVRTDVGGHAALVLQAPLDVDAADMLDGWIGGNVAIKAVKDGYKFTGSDHEYISYAGVMDAIHVQLVDEFGALQGSLVPGMAVQKGQKIQIGTELMAGSLRLVFCNGQEVNLVADMTEGFQGVIGDGDVVSGYTLMSLDLRNKLQELKDAPRRALRMQIYKEIGGLIDSALSMPGSVGVFTTTPGGAVEKILAHWGEAAYTTNSPPPPDQQMLYANDISTYSSTPSSSAIVNAPRTEISFNTNGSIYVENLGSDVLFGIENGEQTGIIAGSAIMLKPADGQSPSSLSSPATSTTAWTASSDPFAWTFSPLDGAVTDSRSPDCSVDTGGGAGLVLESCRVLLDNENVTKDFLIDTYNISSSFLTEHPLDAGTHTLTLGCTTLKGDWEEQSVSFQVNGDPLPSDVLEVTPFADGVWLRWQKVSGAAGYKVWRAAAADGAKSLLTTTPLQQTGFLDNTPLAENFYWIETVADDGGTGMQLTPISCMWSDTLPASAVVETPQGFVLTEIPQGILAEFDDSSTITRWQLERADTVDGPFTLLEPEEDTLVSGYLDTTVVPGNGYVYRLSSLRLDGTVEQNVVLSITLTTQPSPPLSVTAVATDTGVQLLWNQYSDIRAQGIRIYSYNSATDSYGQIADVPLSQTSYTDPQAASGSWLYQVRAYNDSEESLSASVGASHYAITDENAVINLPSAAINVREGDGTIQVPVTRTGNLTESAMIPYRVWHANKGQAVEDVDFVKSAGLLVFAPNQISAEIPVTLLPDSESEWTESFGVSLGAGYGSTVPGGSGQVDIIMEDSDRIMFADYTTEITVNEMNGTVEVALDRIWPSQHEVSVEIAVDDPAGTAVAGTDYVAFTPKRVTFPAGVSRVSTTIDLLDDTVQDGTKVLNLVLQNPEGGAAIDNYYGSLAINMTDSDTYTNQDNVGFNMAQYYALEDAGTITISVTRLNGNSGAVSVNYASADGTAEAGADYTAVAGTLSWAAGEEGDKSFDVTIIDDGDTENDQTIILTLSSPAGGVILGEQSSSVITIMDNEFAHRQASLQFTAAEYSVDESDGQISVVVTRTGESFGTVSVNYATSDGTANDGSDYTGVSGTLTWGDEDVEPKTISIPISNDSINENDETINVALSDPTEEAITGDPSTTVIIVHDDDQAAPEVPFSWNLFLPAMIGGK